MGKYKTTGGFSIGVTREGLHGSMKQVEWALKIREDFLIEAAGKGRLWEVKHHIPESAEWWIRNRDRLWELYNGELQLIIREAQAEKNRARKIKAEAAKNENDTKAVAKPRAAGRRKQVAIQSHGRLRSFAG